MEVKLSDYQQNILNFIRNDNRNLLVNAKAGSGKTFTLVLISKELINDNKKCLFLAFNKHIVDELNRKIDNPNCEIKTIHSVGLSFIRSYLYRKHNNNYELVIDTNKLRNCVKIFFDKHCNQSVCMTFIEDGIDSDEGKKIISEMISDLCKLIDFCRFYNINYKNKHDVIDLLFKVMKNSVICQYKYNGLEDFHDVIVETIDYMKKLFMEPEIDEIKQVPKYIIDYTDMVYFPLYLNMRIPYSLKDKLDYVLVDEAQDLSILQQLFVKKLNNGNTRYIFVGDEKQAIYGFAGADTDSINNIKRNYQLSELPLNICYRCPENVIRMTNSIVPDIEWNKYRPDVGVLKCLKHNEFHNELKQDDVIIVRRNRDIIKLFKELMIDRNIQVKFRSLEIVSIIVNIITTVIKEYIRRYNKGLNTQKQFYEFAAVEYGFTQQSLNNGKITDQQNAILQEKIEQLIQHNLNKHTQIAKSNFSIEYVKKCMEEFKEYGSYNYTDDDDPLVEYYDVILLFMDIFQKSTTAFTLKTFLSHLTKFLSSNADMKVPMLSTVHMMKGGESDRIFIYDYPKFPYTSKSMTTDQMEQERNLQYVAITRPKKELYLILLDEHEKIGDTDAEVLNSNCLLKVDKINKIHMNTMDIKEPNKLEMI